MEQTLSKIITTKVSLSIIDTKESPYFFIRWSEDDKRYRVSTSFKYLNSTYGLHINIIRDFTKITSADDRIKFILSLLNKPQEISSGLEYSNYIDSKEDTELFFIKREWNGEINNVIVFFSLKHWSLNDYLEAKDN